MLISSYAGTEHFIAGTKFLNWYHDYVQVLRAHVLFLIVFSRNALSDNTEEIIENKKTVKLLFFITSGERI
jgi:hypothetical protein